VPDRTIYSSVACGLARAKQVPALKHLLRDLQQRVGTLGAKRSDYKQQSLAATAQPPSPAGAVPAAPGGGDAETLSESDDVSSDGAWLEWLCGTLIDIAVRWALFCSF